MIRRDAFVLRAGTGEIADVGDVDLPVCAVELQTEQRCPEVALCDELPMTVVPQQLGRAGERGDVDIAIGGIGRNSPREAHPPPEHREGVDVAVDEKKGWV